MDFDKDRIFKMAMAFMRVTGKADKSLSNMAEGAYSELLSCVDLRHIFSVSGDEILSLPGESVKKHLANSSSYYYFAATLGQAVDVLINRAQLVSMSRAVVIDALAGALLEEYCDRVCSKLPKTATTRFSPGYGDFPLGFQKKLLSACHGEKLGIRVLPSGLLVPSKSITAVIGV